MKWNLAEFSFCAVLVLSLFLLSCTQQAELTDVVVIAPPPQQTASVPQAEEAAPSSDTQDLDALLAQLEEEEQKTVDEVIVPSDAPVSEEEQPLEEPEAALEPTSPKLSNSKGCRALGSPSTYEACLNGCSRLCGDVSLVDCQDFEGMHEGHIYSCYACSCL